MKFLRRFFLYLIPVLLIAWAFYALIFNWLVPKTATYTIPSKWNRVPMLQTRTTVHGYLGNPVMADSTKEVWKGGIKGREYALIIYYAPDSTTEAFSISYHYQSRLVSRTYVLDSFSTR